MGPDYVLDKGMTAATALTQFTFLKQTADEAVSAVTATADRVIGVVQQTAVAADIGKQAVDVRILGISKVKVGTGGVTRANDVMIDATGQVVAPGAAGTRSVGIALQTGVAGDLVDVMIIHSGRVQA